MRASGGGQRRLTVGGEPSWSPDGSFLFLSAPQGNDDELFRVRANGSDRIRLTNRVGGDYTPQLQPAGVTVTLPQVPSTRSRRYIQTLAPSGLSSRDTPMWPGI